MARDGRDTIPLMPRCVRLLLPLLVFGVSMFLWRPAFAQDEETARERRHRRHHDERSGDEDDERARRREERRRRREEARAAAASEGGTEGAAPSVIAAAPGTAQDGVYAVQREGRTVFTNAGNIAVDGKDLGPMDLPPLNGLDLASATPEQLKLFNTHLESVRDGLQEGDRCEALRLASKAPFHTYIWREHRREVFVALGLFVLGMLGLAWHSRFMRWTMPVPPMVACLYLLYASYVDTQALEDTVSGGLHACTATLAEGSAADPRVLQRRLEQVTKMRETIDGAYAKYQGAIEAVVERYKL